MPFKVFEGDLRYIENSLNRLESTPRVNIIDVQYSTSMIQANSHEGYGAEQQHGVVVRYTQWEELDNRLT